MAGTVRHWGFPPHPARRALGRSAVFPAPLALATLVIVTCSARASDPAAGAPTPPQPSAALTHAGGGSLESPATPMLRLSDRPHADDDAFAMARLRASHDPAIIEIVRQLDERERRLAELRERRRGVTDPMALLSLQREAADITFACERGMLVAQLQQAHGQHRSDAAVAALEHTLARMDRRLAARRAMFQARAARADR